MPQVGDKPSAEATSTSGPHMEAGPLPDEPDLASRWLGSSVICASDESFGDKENLLRTEPPDFEPGHYGNRGEIVDGWETKRRREPGNDWAIVRLGAPGIISSVDIDTSFFTGNYPEFIRVEACGCEGYPSAEDLLAPDTHWVEIVPRSPLRGDMHNPFRVSDPHRFTHVRLNTFPDGGIARLRVFGRVVPDPRNFDAISVDLASQEHGGWVVSSSDEFYSTAQRLNRPDAARSMGEGWETRRRRDPGNDYVLLRLAFAGVVRQLVIDTAHFKYNASAAVEVYASTEEPPPSVASDKWGPLLPRARLQPDTRHVFMVGRPQIAAAIRVDAFPDGGLSRVRVVGVLTPGARGGLAREWLNAMPSEQALECLAGTGLSMEAAQVVLAERPLSKDWLTAIRRHADSVSPSPLDADGMARLAALLDGPAESK